MSITLRVYTVATERLESRNEKGLISKNDTRWNSQLKMVRRVLELDFKGVTEKKELLLSSQDKAILESFVSIFEPFEIATDLLHGKNSSSVSLAIPSYLASFRTSIGLMLLVATIIVLYQLYFRVYKIALDTF